jgi:hypothetical protein
MLLKDQQISSYLVSSTSWQLYLAKTLKSTLKCENWFKPNMGVAYQFIDNLNNSFTTSSGIKTDIKPGNTKRFPLSNGRFCNVSCCLDSLLDIFFSLLLFCLPELLLTQPHGCLSTKRVLRAHRYQLWYQFRKYL